MNPGRGLLVVLAIGAAAFSFAQANPRGEATYDGGNVSIDYGRPSAKGRDLLAMAEAGSYWRLGADQATKLTTKVNIVVGGDTVAPGEYTLLGHFPAKGEFELVVAKSVSAGKPNEVAGKIAGDIARDQEHVEQMTIDIESAGDGAAIVLSWGPNRISMPFEIAS